MVLKTKKSDSKLVNDIATIDYNDRGYLKSFADTISSLRTYQYGSTMLLNTQQSSELSELCKTILSVDRCLLFVASVNNQGRITESKFRSDEFLRNLTGEELEMMFMQCALQASMIKDFDNKLGPFKYVAIERETITIFLFPFYDRIILLASEPCIHPRSLAGKISEIIIQTMEEVKTLKMKHVISNISTRNQI